MSRASEETTKGLVYDILENTKDSTGIIEHMEERV